MKKRNKDSQNGKALVIASALGIAAVVVSVIAAYNSTMKRLVPTGISSGIGSLDAFFFDKFGRKLVGLLE